jgi:hypothetical protein
MTVRRPQTRSCAAVLVLIATLAYPLNLRCLCWHDVAAHGNCGSQHTEYSSVPLSITAECYACHSFADQPKIVRFQGVNDFVTASQRFPAPGPQRIPVQRYVDRRRPNTLWWPVLSPLPILLRSCTLLI